MGKKRAGHIAVEVRGISYEAFARVKWRQLIRWGSLLLGLLALAVLGLTLSGRVSGELPVTALLTAALAVLAAAALYRSSIRREYRSAGLSDVRLQYLFDRDGWTVQAGQVRQRVLWKNTWRVRRTPGMLMLYPSRKSVNLVPLQGLSQEDLRQILRWCSGET